MGQAHSRGSQDPRPRNNRSRSRPMSWAPSWTPSLSLPRASELPEMQQRSPTASRPTSMLFNPLSMLAEPSDDGPSGAGSQTHLLRRRSRIARARSSLHSLPNLFHRRTMSRPQDSDSTQAAASPLALPSPRRSPLRHSTTSYERGPFLPRVHVPELDLDFDDSNNTREADSPVLSPLRLTSSRRDGRASSMISSLRPDRGLRSMTSSLRRRRSPLRQSSEDQAAMLSRLLSVAAAATAASLMGDDHRAVAEARNVVGDSEDGTFESFLQALQNGRIASALRQSGNEEGGSEAPAGSHAPLNFFRMFRFGSRAANTRRVAIWPRPDSDNQSEEEEGGDGRMVPIIIVGISSINPGSGSSSDDNIPPFLDALSSFPTPVASPGDNTIDGILRQPQNGTRFSHRRRASMGGLNPFPANYDSQRHYRSPERPRPWPTLSDSPSGPLPPPSTPASSGLSAVSSGTTTPTPSATPPSPTMQSSVPSRRSSFIRGAGGSGLESTAEEPQTQQRIPRQRRLSESDFTRFGSGAARRNGVVEPDHNPGEGSRSWIIYVLGGSYPENHPILTTPSLFTNSPTYEDMLLLSTLLGPGKPPVASEEDVASAPGLYRIRQVDDHLVAETTEGGDLYWVAVEQSCPICLCNFEVDDELRQLVKCQHMFHKECIEQWLTTGRNSCPLCRGQGVNEKTPSEQPAAPDSDFAPVNEAEAMA